jgi:hypothetical protein
VSLRDYLCNNKTANTNQPTIADMVTPKQILTGAEPADLTFELPVRYEAGTNMCSVTLLVDANPDDPESDDAGGKQQELVRAPSDSSLLVWHAIYDPAARHAVQVQLTGRSDGGGFFACKGPAVAVNTSNLCQFSLDCATYLASLGARFHARLPETNGDYSIECLTTNGAHLATLTGSATNGEFDTTWNLVDDQGHRLNGETFNTIVHITLPNSGRTQTLRGP